VNRLSLRIVLVLLFVSVLTGVDVSADPKQASRRQTFEFRDNFQTDTRSNYKTRGPIVWTPGRFTLDPGASIEKPLNAGARIECEMGFDFPKLTGKGLVSETIIVFQIEDTMNSLSSLQTSGGVSMAAVVRAERSGQSLKGVVEISEFPRTQKQRRISKYTGEHFRVPTLKRPFEIPVSTRDTLWNFGYNHGLLTVSCGGQKLGAAWRQNYAANVVGVRVIQSQAALDCSGVTVRGRVRPPAVSAQQMVHLLAAGANELQTWQLFNARRFREAVAGFQQSYEVAREAFGTDHYYTMCAQNNLAIVLDGVGDYVRAERLRRDGLAAHKSILGDEHPEMAMELSNLGSSYCALNDFARAEPLYREALRINQFVFGEVDPQTAATLEQLAGVYAHLGEDAKAESLYSQSLSIVQTVLGDSSRETADARVALATFYLSRREFARAEPLLRQALLAVNNAIGVQNGTSARILNQLSVVYQGMGDYDRALKHAEQALALAEKMNGRTSPLYATILCNLGRYRHRTGDDVKAEPFCRQALEIMEAIVARTSSVLCEREQLQWIASERNFLDAYLDLGERAPIRAEDRYRHCLRWKGAVFAAQAQIRVLRANPELAGEFARLQSVSGQLAAIAFQSPDSQQSAMWKRRVRDLSDEKESIERELAGKSAEFRQQQTSLAIAPDQLRAALPADAALVDFLEYTGDVRTPQKQAPLCRERRLAAFVLRRDRAIRYLDLGPVEPIVKHIATWRASYGMSPEAIDAARALKRTVWSPLEDEFSGAATVFLSPDGDLAQFPLGALPGKSEGSYLLEDLNLVFVPVPRLLPESLAGGRVSLAGPSQNRPAPSALLVGDIAFDSEPQDTPAADVGKTLLAAATRRAALRSGNVYFPPLPGSTAEVEEIAALHVQSFGSGRQVTLRGRQATEDAFRTQAPRCRYVHLATHGFFQPVKETGELAGLEGGGRVAGLHPGLQCGLALAGANNRASASSSSPRDQDDGILTALEVASLDLRDVDLVTLSACETGLGKTAGGEGVLGLQRAFQMAGARNVVATLWKVDDQGTAALMRLFYHKLWVEKKTAGAALRGAQLWILNHPEQIPVLATARGANFKRAVKLPERGKPAQAQPKSSPYLWAGFVIAGSGQ
jgi:CHAT domain-containing protein/tetratricopeptide (TPR) repeat protein